MKIISASQIDPGTIIKIKQKTQPDMYGHYGYFVIYHMYVGQPASQPAINIIIIRIIELLIIIIKKR